MRLRWFGVTLLFLLPVRAGAEGGYWCWDADEVSVHVDGSTLHVAHEAALINCCPEPIVYEVEMTTNEIEVTERSESVCNCDCCFNLEFQIEDVPPGSWTLTYHWLDHETYQWVSRTVPVEVPDLGQGVDPFVGAQWHSGCLEPSSIPSDSDSSDPETRNEGWGPLKAHYRG
ncbi:MAG: hypothetical protein KDA27_09185 [Candidatus Eisenbacteria bacterium]|uniref:Uncharacterized protein n=1 Tax=Eiseniibacteriota bacterium TaxID=2212470 RepID=A0A956SCX5_UNCEI|nr:hypothetical protein [Candidatus Eisenbacteria bacterium]